MSASPATASQKQASRRFNRLVNNPTVEDYSLRYAPRSFRRWSEYGVATAALGGIAYLADFAIGGSIGVTNGFASAVWAIIAAAIVIFLTGIPIAYYAAKYNIDMDLLTRGAGFGYLGSTITSLIYASFTIIFFALEGTIMAQGINLYSGLALPLAYLLSALVIIPLVYFGMTLLSRLQAWTQPIWLVLLVMPFIAIASKDPSAFARWTAFGGKAAHGPAFNILAFGTGAGVALSLIAQIGEQVDYLRFMPDRTKRNAPKWWSAVLAAGPGWVILGALKQLGGAFLAFYIADKVGLTNAVEPIHQLVAGFDTAVGGPSVALLLATALVVLSQVKINVTNAYSGSLSWSNFFSRVFHWHPGRAVWVVFNVGIALSLMEAGMFNVLNSILGFYSNVAIAWIGAVVADLVITKPLLNVSPSYIEFKRAHLHNINPVGFGSMAVASVLSITAFFGAFGPTLKAFSPFLALAVAFVLAPLIAVATKGRWYVAREPARELSVNGSGTRVITCAVCGDDYEAPDMASCPHHAGAICSLCCTLEKSCHDVCKQVDLAKSA